MEGTWVKDPCNVILRGVDGGDVMVSAIDPVASMPRSTTKC